MSSTQLFRTGLNGYKKEDVNEYILAINNELAKTADSLNKTSCELLGLQRTSTDEIARLKAALDEANTRLAKTETELSAEKEENLRLSEKCKEADESIAILNSRLEKAEKKNAETAQAETCEDDYENLCAKAGEVLVIASNTADDILKKANDEAKRILSDATDKKDSIFKNITETATTAADGLSDYIKNAVDECIGRINSSIRQVEVLKNTPEEKIPVFKIKK